MLFNSYPFLFGFLPLLLVAVFLLGRRQSPAASRGVLLGASLLFYAWWRWEYVFLLLFSIAFNFACLQSLWRREPGSRVGLRTVTAGVAVNLALLGYFKYANFFVETLDTAFGLSWNLAPVVLPLAISFFTFQQVAYLVDAYRGRAGRSGLVSYSLAVTFFPHLIAGPIVRYEELVPQFEKAGTFVRNNANLAAGLFILAIGLFKKVVIADTFAPWTDRLFDHAADLSVTDAWGAALSFTLQIYFDFSGYSDMAIGLARMMNVRLPENFDSPYQADSIIDFWRRWHMTLSAFLRDYLYIPLGGNRRGAMRRDVNLFVTMLLGGLWHGANWTLAAWGSLHAVYLSINYLWRRTGIELPRAVSWPLTFTAVVFALVLFRARTFERAGMVFAGMAGRNGFAWGATHYSIGWWELECLALALAVTLWCPNRQTIMSWEWRSDTAYALAFSVIAGLGILALGDPAPFFYFQF